MPPPSNNPVTPDKSTENPAKKSVSQKSVSQKPEAVPDLPSVPEVIPTKPEITETVDSLAPKAPVVGQVYINQLLLTLFPDRKYFQS